MAKNDKYEQLKEQVDNIIDFIYKVNEINPDYQLYCAGSDVYVCEVNRVLKEVKEIMDDIEAGKKPIYTKDWVKKTLKETKDNYV